MKFDNHKTLFDTVSMKLRNFVFLRHFFFYYEIADLKKKIQLKKLNSPISVTGKILKLSFSNCECQ